MKRIKLIIASGVVVLLLGLSTINSRRVEASGNQPISNTLHLKSKLRKVSSHYDAKTKSINISGLATQGEKVIIKYGNKKVATPKVNAQHKFNAKIKFTGYKTFTLYAVKKNKRITPIFKLNANRYATTRPIVIKTSRSSKGIFYDVKTASNKGRLIFYFNDKKFYAQNVHSTKTRIAFSNKKLCNKKGHFTVRYMQDGKKASPAVKATIVKVNQVDEVFF